MNRISLNTSDLKKLRFTSNQSVIIGNQHLTFKSSFEMMKALQELSEGMEYGPIGNREYDIPYAAQVRPVVPKDTESISKSVEEMFYEALDYFVRSNAPHAPKCMDDSKEMPALIREIATMKCVLMCCIFNYDFDARSADTTDADRLNAFSRRFGHWWVEDLCASESAMEMKNKFVKDCFSLLNEIANAD